MRIESTLRHAIRRRPVVHAVGGLRDTVLQYDPFNGTGNGWTFDSAETHKFIDARESPVRVQRFPGRISRDSIPRIRARLGMESRRRALRGSIHRRQVFVVSRRRRAFS